MSRWYECNPYVQKKMYMIMERCTRPVVLTAGKFFILSLNTLTTVIIVMGPGCLYLPLCETFWVFECQIVKESKVCPKLMSKASLQSSRGRTTAGNVF